VGQGNVEALSLTKGPRTEPGRVDWRTWPVTSRSNRWRIAASRCLTLGAASWRVSRFAASVPAPISFPASRSPVLVAVGEFFVGRHYLHQGEHSVQEMLPHVADHQIRPWF